MAIVVDNSIVKGLSGRLGGALVFKKYGGKTVVAQRSAPAQTQSEHQKANRNKLGRLRHSRKRPWLIP